MMYAGVLKETLIQYRLVAVYKNLDKLLVLLFMLLFSFSLLLYFKILFTLISMHLLYN